MVKLLNLSLGRFLGHNYTLMSAFKNLGLEQRYFSMANHFPSDALVMKQPGPVYACWTSLSS